MLQAANESWPNSCNNLLRLYDYLSLRVSESAERANEIASMMVLCGLSKELCDKSSMAAKGVTGYWARGTVMDAEINGPRQRKSHGVHGGGHLSGTTVPSASLLLSSASAPSNDIMRVFNYTFPAPLAPRRHVNLRACINGQS